MEKSDKYSNPRRNLCINIMKQNLRIIKKWSQIIKLTFELYFFFINWFNLISICLLIIHIQCLSENFAKHGFCKKSLRKNATLNSWTLFSSKKGTCGTIQVPLCDEKSIHSESLLNNFVSVSLGFKSCFSLLVMG